MVTEVSLLQADQIRLVSAAPGRFLIVLLALPVTSYFSTDIIKGEMAHARFYPEEIRRQIPLCEYRKYTISEIINAVIESGFALKRFDEHPAWTDPGLPGEFTVITIKE